MSGAGSDAIGKRRLIYIDPQWAWRQQRIAQLLKAIQVYLDADELVGIVVDWLDEIEAHENWLEVHRGDKNQCAKRELTSHDKIEILLRSREVGCQINKKR